MKKQFLIIAGMSFLTACDNIPTVEDFMKDGGLRAETYKICEKEILPGDIFDIQSKNYKTCTNLITAMNRCLVDTCAGGEEDNSWKHLREGLVDKDGHAIYTKQPRMDKLP